MELITVTFILALASETLASTTSLKHVVVVVGGQLVKVTLRHVTVARVAHYICNTKRHFSLAHSNERIDFYETDAVRQYGAKGRQGTLAPHLGLISHFSSTDSKGTSIYKCD